MPVVIGESQNPETDPLSLHIDKLNWNVGPRVTSITSSTTPTFALDTTDILLITALAAGATFGAPTGATSVNEGQVWVIRIKDNGSAQTLAWNGVFRPIGCTLPTITVISKTIYIAGRYNFIDTKADTLAVGIEP